jgi:DNA repair exonuclease SbcCD nuclease subunit
VAKFVFLGDVHLSDKQIMTRVDNTAETVLSKLNWVVDFAIKNNADIIHTGDLTTGQLLTNRYRIAVRRVLGKLMNAGRKFYSISGNHDASGGVYESIWDREYGLLNMDGYLDHLDNIHIQWGNGYIVGMSAYNYSFPYNIEESVFGVVVHAFVQDAFGDTLVVYPDDLKKRFPNLQFLLCGHEHQAYSTFQSRDGVQVIRPGSLMRTDSGKSSNRVPRIGLWDTDGAFEYVDLPSEVARPYEEVFYMEKKSLQDDAKNALSRFITQLQTSGQTVMDIGSAVKAQLETVPEGDKAFIREDLASQGFLI